MGYYIEVPKNTDKAGQLQKLYGAVVTPRPAALIDIPAGKRLICVVQNGFFDAAALCYDDREFQEFACPDERPRTWLLMDKAVADKLAGYDERG